MSWKTGYLLLAVGLFFAGCNSGQGPVPVGSGNSSGSADSLMGGGSSFVYPIMNRWSSDYNKKTGVQVNYQSLGSSGGIKQFSNKTLDFGASDAPMNEEQIAEAKDPVLHIPVVMGAVAITYNLPGVKGVLKFSGPVLADIYLGKINKWNDPALTAINPGVALPDAEIVTVRRADGSGTTFIFAEFLGKTSSEWKEKVGVGNSLDWPTQSLAGKGNEGVSAQVQRQANSIGYVELVYALEANLPAAAIINEANNAITPSPESVTAAAADLTSVPEDLRLSITNAPGTQAYPMSGLTWVVARPQMANPAKADALAKFLEYILSDDAQALANKLKYARLPEKLLTPARENAKKIGGNK